MKMNMMRIYDENVKIKGNDLVVTFDRILEKFYNETLFDQDPDSAKAQLVTLLKEGGCSRRFVTRVQELVSPHREEGEEAEEDHWEATLCGLWGREALNTLRFQVRRGEADADKIRNFARSPQVGALNVYEEHRHLGLVETFGRILEYWANETLVRYQPQEAQETLIRVLRRSRWAEIFIVEVQSKMFFTSTDRQAQTSG